jgi:hypothetical protein
MDSLTGKMIRWTFDDGPMAGVKIEHTFDAEGGVTWHILDGPHEGATLREKSYAAFRVNEKTWVVSYLAASGHTLTVVLNLEDGRAYAFGSNETSWVPMHGRFEIVH